MAQLNTNTAINNLKGRLFTDSLEEDKLTKSIEKQTAKIPSVGFLGLALGAMAVSLGLELFSSNRRKDTASFVGLWVPTLLLFGIYNKLVKQHGSDIHEH